MSVQGLAAVNIKITIFWNATPCGLVDTNDSVKPALSIFRVEK
jgi:hypothetical protein